VIGLFVVFRVDRMRTDTRFGGAPCDSDCDFAAIGDEEMFESHGWL